MDTDVRFTAAAESLVESPAGGTAEPPAGAPAESPGDGESATGAAAFGVLAAVQTSVGVASVPAGERTAGEWMALVAECSAALGVVAAARDAAIVRLAAIDEHVDDDGVVTEQVNGLGTVCVDADAMVAAAAGCTTAFAQELVEQAVTRVVRVPDLHAAMLDGTVDDYRSRCVAGELGDVPVDLARTVVDVLRPDLGGMSGPALRRRTRQILFRLSPDLLRERIKRSRQQIGLRRWVGEPGTDAWSGRFPSEQAATAWAAIDALARRYRAAGTYPSLEMARGFALMDLVHGHATVETMLNVTVPADTVAGLGGPGLDDSSHGSSDISCSGDGCSDDGCSDDGCRDDGCRDDGGSGIDTTGDDAIGDDDAAGGASAAASSGIVNEDAEQAEVGEPSLPGAQRRRKVSPERLSGVPTRRSAIRTHRLPEPSDAEPVNGEHPDADPADGEHPDADPIDESAGASAIRVTQRADVDAGAVGQSASVGVAHAASAPASAVTGPASAGSSAHRCAGEPPSAAVPTAPATAPAAAAAAEAKAAAAGQRSGSSVAFVGAAGVQGSSITWLPGSVLRSWLSGSSSSLSSMPTASSSACLLGGGLPSVMCHPVTGALLDPGDALSTEAYRPGERLRALVRTRDGRCRFPGCTIAARSCDLDHVRPWPTGPTTASNLMCLCRRHHRVKQRHRWRVRLLGDGRVLWSDPRGHSLMTWPVDHLGVRETRTVPIGRDDPEAATPQAAAHQAGEDMTVAPTGEVTVGPTGEVTVRPTDEVTVGPTDEVTVRPSGCAPPLAGARSWPEGSELAATSEGELRFAARMEVWDDHQRTDHQRVEHRNADHRNADHRNAEHQNADHDHQNAPDGIDARACRGPVPGWQDQPGNVRGRGAAGHDIRRASPFSQIESHHCRAKLGIDITIEEEDLDRHRQHHRKQPSAEEPPPF